MARRFLSNRRLRLWCLVLETNQLCELPVRKRVAAEGGFGMGIREAKSKDYRAVEALYQALVPNSKNISVSSERLEQIKADPNNFLFVYQDGEVIQGTIFLTFCLDPMYEFRPYAVIENFIVDGVARGHGIGTLLLNHVEELCVAEGCTKIMLMSSAARIKAHEFFIKHGFNGDVSRGFKKYIPIKPSSTQGGANSARYDIDD